MSEADTPPDETALLPEHDTTVAHSARVHDYWLGGKNNYAADRTLADSILAAVPHQRRHVRANRDFMVRAVDHLVRELGVRQFIDIGTGLPACPNVHEVAHQADPTTRVLYVDNDPVVMTHARALMPTTGRPASLGFLQADLCRPDAVLDRAERGGLIDLTRPVAVLLLAMLPLLPDAVDPYDIVARLTGRLPSGSYLVATHDTADFEPMEMFGHAFAAQAAGMPFTPRSRDEFARFFTGLDLVEPGIVPVTTWRPRRPVSADARDAHLHAGVGRVR